MIKIVATVVIVIAFLSGGSVIAEPNYSEYGYHPMMSWGGWFMGPVMMLIFIAFLVGAVLLIARFLGWHPASGDGRSGDRSLSILRERFARGEIDQAEFETRRKALE
ncbi:SHOCT domain-containing protein (plasmid) [Thalassobaculum sp. OXR-137]|uniref:SHOCT domain-containing protein n=1 Tax=Thalassobaculum TaxID=526215 RepID=UPI00040DA50C|nr:MULTISPECIES: SHOCT domain-containing protein [Thalassobaculum]WPZ37175.1 SHOCT domain-containing protein [Thalassobaculum sp. OXR-137]